MRLDLGGDRPSAVASTTIPLDLRASPSALADWLATRYEGRFGGRVPGELRARLRDCLAANPGGLDGALAVPPSGQSGEVLWAALLEELRFVRNALPLAPGSGAWVPVRVVIGRGQLADMARGRSRFDARRKELARLHHTYWTRTLPPLRASVTHYGRRPPPGHAELTVVLTTIAERQEAMKRRLDELRPFLASWPSEVVVVVGDPDNCRPGYWTALKTMLARLSCPATMIASARNTIVTNRNLGMVAASAPLVAFVDDDCRLVGPIFPRLLEAMRDRPEVGVLSPVSYDHHRRAHRPRLDHLTAQLTGDLFVVTQPAGMVFVVRRELAWIVPFVPWWPSRDENALLGQQLHRLGFLSAYLMASDAYLIHEDVPRRLTTHPLAVAWMLIAEGLRSMLEPRGYREIRRESIVTRRLREHVGLEGLSTDGATALWRELRRAVTRFAAGDDTRFPRVPMSEAVLGTDRVRYILSYLRGHRAAFRRFAATTYAATGLCRVNPYLGALCVQVPGATPEEVGAAEVPSQTTAWAT